ncbi:MAG: ROK family protein [Actinobacteria bacterium]|nr:MAG: ROK family protein [Actinomycetota bacterium]
MPLVEHRIGIDVGGSGIKGAIVDREKGELVSERLRIETPQPADVPSVARTVAEVVDGLDFPGPIGAGFPSVIRDGVALSANNIHHDWIGTDVAKTFSEATGRKCTIVNDADAAGLAEARFGAARDVPRKALVLTFGTGIGSALMFKGELVPNFELGQIEFEGVRPAEQEFSAKARKKRNLSWDDWGKETARYLEYVQEVLNPDLIIFGGGVVKEWEQYHHLLPSTLRIVPAQLLNNAGIVGASLVADGALS